MNFFSLLINTRTSVAKQVWRFLIYLAETVFSTHFLCLAIQTISSTLIASLVHFIHFYDFIYEADFIQSLLSTEKKQLASRFNLTYRYIDDVLSIQTTQNLKIIWARCMFLNLRSRTPQRTPLLFPTYTYYCPLGGMVNFRLLFTTNEMISISTS